MPNHRNQRLESNIHIAISRIINEDVSNANIGFTTITKVNLTSDQSELKVYLNVIGNTEKTITALKKATGFIKFELSKKVKLRKVPNIIWVYDQDLEKRQSIEKIIKNLKEE